MGTLQERGFATQRPPKENVILWHVYKLSQFLTSVTICAGAGKRGSAKQTWRRPAKLHHFFGQGENELCFSMLKELKIIRCLAEKKTHQNADLFKPVVNRL